MNASELLGAVGAASLRERLANASEGDGLARFMLDRLTGQQVAAVVQALLLDNETTQKIKIAVPRDLVAAFDLPPAVITDERTVALRHAECDRPALLLANSDDDQGASLQDVTLLGAKQLTEEPRLWVEAAAAGLGLPESHSIFGKPRFAALPRPKTGRCIRSQTTSSSRADRSRMNSKPLLEALGWALPALQLPRDSRVFPGHPCKRPSACCALEKALRQARH